MLCSVNILTYNVLLYTEYYIYIKHNTLFNIMCFNSWILQVWNEVDMDMFSVKENYLYPTHTLYYFCLLKVPISTNLLR